MKVARLCADGEVRCANCNDPLPPVEVWPGHTRLHCAKPQCQQAAQHTPGLYFVADHTEPCSAAGCKNFAPAGAYDKHHKHFVCSVACWTKFDARRKSRLVVHLCSCGCGTEILTGRPNQEHHFVNRAHDGAFRTEQVMKRFGAFRPLVEEYLAGWASRNYKGRRGIEGPRLALSRLFEFAGERGIASLDEINAAFIDAYLNWGENLGLRYVASSMPAISTFFKWLKKMGRREHDNPVIPEFHTLRGKAYEPRPYTEEEMEFAWKLNRLRGNTRTWLEMAILEETGVRIGELANIRLTDVNPTKQRIFIRLPTKNGRARTVPYGAKTTHYLAAWLEVRKQDCRHDHLLHNRTGRPCTDEQIRLELQGVLCKAGTGGKRSNVEGFDRWIPHRMRHTMATRLTNGGADMATSMAICGWQTYTAMCGYCQVNLDAAQKGYKEAIERAEALDRAPKPRRISLADYLKERGV